MAETNLAGAITARDWARAQGLRVWAEIDLDRLEANVKALAARAAPAHLLAVVKANAYGHGAVPVARTTLEAGAWGLGVIDVDEGEVLRRAGIAAPILVLGSSPAVVAPRLVAANLRATVASRDVVEALSRAAVAAGREAVIHIKVETGLNRYGASPDESVALAESARDLPGLRVEGLHSHLASVDEGDQPFTREQANTLRECADRLPWVPLRHIASTGGLLEFDDLALNMVRAGIGIYGIYPSASRDVALAPVMALRSRVARVQTLAAGESVGYGRSWVAAGPSRIATVMAGYADGIRRTLSNVGVALVRGQRAPYAGRVAMDMHMLDVTLIPDVAAGDEVTLLGAQGDEEISADEVAALCGTISYEVVTGVMARVPRIYVRGGRIVAVEDLAGYRELA